MTLSRSGARASVREETPIGRWTAWAFLVSFGMFELQDVLSVLLIPLSGVANLVVRMAMVFVPPLVLGLGLGYALLRSVGHALIGGSAFALAWYSMTAFRGLWIRPGTLDDWNFSSTRWSRIFLGMLALGLVVGALVGRRARPVSTRASWTALATFVPLSALSAFLLFTRESFSVFPPLRPVALLGVAILASVLLIGEARDA